MTFRHLSNIHLVPILLFMAVTEVISAKEAPDGFGQLKNAPEVIPGGVDDAGREYFYNGQPSTNGKIILTASNVFFTSGSCKAEGASKLPKVGDDELIGPNFGWLDWKIGGGSLRWYILVEKPGVVNFSAYLKVPAGEIGTKITAQFSGQSKEVITSGDPPTGVGELHRIDAFGSAVEGAHLLRMRWRPAAVHGRYDTAKVSGAKILVFTTRSVCDISSYSPITTPEIGINRVTLSGLKSETTYYYRVLMNGSDCRVWNDDTLSFTTPAAGEPAIKNSPMVGSKNRQREATRRLAGK